MSEFFSYISDKLYIGLILIVLIALMIFMWVKAFTSGRKRREERERIIARLEYEKKLRSEFKTLQAEQFEPGKVDDERLLFGVAANIQMSIEKQEDLTQAFNGLSEFKKNIYALNYVIEDSRYETLSEFFRANGEPLTSQAQKAVKQFIGGEISEIFDKMYPMMNEENEEVSLDSEAIISLDSKYKEAFNDKKSVIIKSIADSIRASADEFLS